MTDPFKFSNNPSKSMKPFLNLNRLIHRLECSDGLKLTFTDKEKEEALTILKTTNYYTLSIYKKQLPYDNTKNIFTFSNLIQLVEFDTFLRQAISPFTQRIEEIMKTTVVTSTCVNYNGRFSKGECYLDQKIYATPENYEEIIVSLEQTVEENKTSLTIKHHIEKKNGHIPLWVLAEEMTFGQLSFFFSSLNDDIRKNWAYYGFLSRNQQLKKVKGEEINARLASWFSAAWFLRNLCAHNQRLYGKLLITGNPQIYSSDMRKMKRYGKKKNDNRDLFAYLISIKNILIFDTLSTQTRWNTFLNKLENEIEQNSNVVKLFKIGFVPDWKNLLEIDLDKGLNQLL
ncbi:Abi family protein [Suicoccus acidiformans]|nr:Abi family protein [Suicoccus acidiformans]